MRGVADDLDEVIMIDLIANGAVLAPFRRNLEGESWSDFFSAYLSIYIYAFPPNISFISIQLIAQHHQIC